MARRVRGAPVGMETGAVLIEADADVGDEPHPGPTARRQRLADHVPWVREALGRGVVDRSVMVLAVQLDGGDALLRQAAHERLSVEPFAAALGPGRRDVQHVALAQGVGEPTVLVHQRNAPRVTPLVTRRWNTR